MTTFDFPSQAEQASLLPKAGGWLVEDATGEALALCWNREEADYWIGVAKMYYDDALCCGHPGAAAWVTSRMPIVARMITVEERERVEDDGTPTLQREP